MTIPLEQHLPGVSPIALGCMGLGGGWNHNPLSRADERAATTAVVAALNSGINFFDHADIYAHGKAEAVFGRVLGANPAWRERLYIQSKGGIRPPAAAGQPTQYDFSKEHILACVDGSLRRLGVERLDVWLLHRPDPLMEPTEVAEAFAALKAAGKVRFFGVSNMHGPQLAFLQRHLPEPLVANQIDLSLAQLGWLDEGVLAGNPAGRDVNFTAGTLEYCRAHGVQIQAWGSLAQGRFSGRERGDEPAHVADTAALVAELAERYDTSREAVVLAWLRRHPAGIQPVVGTTNPDRIRAAAAAMTVTLSRRDWYALYVSARGAQLP